MKYISGVEDKILLIRLIFMFISVINIAGRLRGRKEFGNGRTLMSRCTMYSQHGLRLNVLTRRCKHKYRAHLPGGIIPLAHSLLA